MNNVYDYLLEIIQDLVGNRKISYINKGEVLLVDLGEDLIESSEDGETEKIDYNYGLLFNLKGTKDTRDEGKNLKSIYALRAEFKKRVQTYSKEPVKTKDNYYVEFCNAEIIGIGSLESEENNEILINLKITLNTTVL